MASDLVGVYGSLRDGLHNHYLLKDSVFLTEGRITGKMFSFGGFPGLVAEGPKATNPITVEVYLVSQETLTRLDILEGHPDWYTRRKVPVFSMNPNIPNLSAWVYFQASIPANYPIVECGDWKKYVEEGQEKCAKPQRTNIK